MCAAKQAICLQRLQFNKLFKLLYTNGRFSSSAWHLCLDMFHLACIYVYLPCTYVYTGLQVQLKAHFACTSNLPKMRGDLWGLD